MNRRLLFALLFIGAVFFLYSSCKKDGTWPESVFYGKWKTSYGDTITFERQDNKNIISTIRNGSASTSPGPWGTPVIEYAYLDRHLFLNENPGQVNQFRELQSFAWVQRGNIFTVQNTDWFPFMSSISTFTFTKIQ